MRARQAKNGPRESGVDDRAAIIARDALRAPGAKKEEKE
jgi:hypothetical protein